MPGILINSVFISRSLVILFFLLSLSSSVLGQQEHGVETESQIERKAIEQNEAYAAEAARDPALDSIRNHAEFKSINGDSHV